MKSMTKKLSLLLMLSAVLFLSSCLDSGSNSYIGSEEFSYITRSQSTGTVYARTLAGYMITSPKIQQLTPGTGAFLTYQVTEETEKVALENNLVAYKVDLGAEPVSIDKTLLFHRAPEDVTPVKFESLMEPVFARNDYFGDLWLFPYTYSIKKGQTAKIYFYKADKDQIENPTTDVIIDVRLVITGTPEGGATEKIEGKYITVDMSSLRMVFDDEADAAGNLNVKFRYYRSDYEGLFTSAKTYSISIDQK